MHMSITEPADTKESLNDCLKAFESCLKIICQKRGWSYGEKDTATPLIEIVFEYDLIDSHMKSHFTALGSTLKSGVPTVRNRLCGDMDKVPKK